MPISISFDDIRAALDSDSDEYPDSELQFEQRQAEAIVNDELAPHAKPADADRLELAGALLAGAYVEDEQTVDQMQRGSRSISFSTETSLTLFEQAKQMDPSGRLEVLANPSASIGVPDVREF